MKFMKNVAILTMDQADDFAVYDQVLDAPMAELGWQTQHISWRSKSANWNDFDAVIIRSTWDYQDDVEAFIEVLQTIDSSSATLLNSLDIVKWNINKHYLRELESHNVAIVPTLWRETFDFDELESYFEHFQTHQIVIKPTISANADNTFWLKKDTSEETFGAKKELLKQALSGRQLMIQPFVQSVIDEGEFSLFYFSGDYSHCILKTPQTGDFRVQEEHGGLIQSQTPCNDLLTSAKNALQNIPKDVLYARIDLVRDDLNNNLFNVMEVELIEPSLYFTFAQDSPKLFCQAFDQWMKKL